MRLNSHPVVKTSWSVPQVFVALCIIVGLDGRDHSNMGQRHCFTGSKKSMGSKKWTSWPMSCSWALQIATKFSCPAIHSYKVAISSWHKALPIGCHGIKFLSRLQTWWMGQHSDIAPYQNGGGRNPLGDQEITRFTPLAASASKLESLNTVWRDVVLSVFGILLMPIRRRPSIRTRLSSPTFNVQQVKSKVRKWRPSPWRIFTELETKDFIRMPSHSFGDYPVHHSFLQFCCM